MLTVLFSILCGYAAWMLLGYIAFRILNKVNHGRRLMKTYSSDKFAKPLTPRDGLLYMFLGGGVSFVIVSIAMTCTGIKNAYNRQFANGINHSMGANRFFGIK